MGMEIRPGDKVLVVVPDGFGELYPQERLRTQFEEWWPGVTVVLMMAPGIQPDVIAVYRDGLSCLDI